MIIVSLLLTVCCITKNHSVGVYSTNRITSIGLLIPYVKYLLLFNDAILFLFIKLYVVV